MNKIRNLIYRITEFGTHPSVESKDKIKEIQRLLVEVYAMYLNLQVDVDINDYGEVPDVDYNTIRKNAEANFPEFGLYHSLWESHKLNKDPDVVTGDAIDDISDIIKDLLEVKWRFENTSEQDALWTFQNLMRIHSEQHLVDFLKYLKDLNG